MPSRPPPSELRSGSSAGPAPWWVTAFGPTYRWLYPHRDDVEARDHAPFLVKALRARPGASVLDLACGDGRYARALAARGLRVTGVDLSETLLDVARIASPGLPGAPQYVRADLRRLPFGPQFAGAVSLFTSFGYFDDPEDDRRVLREVARVLVPGARFVLDVPHAEVLLRGLVRESVVRRDGWVVRTERSVDDARPGGPVVVKTSRIEAEDGAPVAVVDERVRLYAPDVLDGLLAEAGLVPEGVPAGGLLGEPFSAAAARYVRTSVRSAGRR